MGSTRSRSIALLAATFALAVLVGRPDVTARQLGVGPLPLSPLLESPTAHAGTTIHAALRVAIPDGLHIQSNAPRDPTVIASALTFEAVEGVTVVEEVYPGTIDLSLPGYDEPLAVFEGDLLVGVTIDLADTLPPGALTLPARFRYQACNDRQCFLPRTLPVSWTIEVVPSGDPIARSQPDVFDAIAFGSGTPPPAAEAPAAPATATAAAPTPSANTPEAALALFDQFEIRGSAGGYMDEETFLQFISDAEQGVTRSGWFDNRGPLAILALVFIGGLALNLTPCVLPMIPINLMIIGAGAQGGKRGRGFLLGSVYGAAMALVYGVLGLVVILTAGTFGTINASPWFNIAIAVLFVVLGLAMFDVFAIDFSRFSNRIRFSEKSRGTFMLAFGMGAVAALLAGACVAPVVIQVVVFASDLHASGSAAALALPFVLGLGMALPWPIAGAGFAALPKPGAWMVRVKQAMGVFILATAAYYGYVTYEIISSRWVDPARVSASVEEMVESGWHASLVEGLETARRDRTPVLIDFWATWCKNCLTMDKTTLASDAVEDALDGYTKIKFQAEDLEASPARELMERVGGIGLPQYAILQPRD